MAATMVSPRTSPQDATPRRSPSPQVGRSRIRETHFTDHPLAAVHIQWVVVRPSKKILGSHEFSGAWTDLHCYLPDPATAVGERAHHVPVVISFGCGVVAVVANACQEVSK